MGTQEPSTVVLRHHHPANTRNHKDRDVLGGPPEVANTGTTKRSTHRLFFAKSVLFVCVCSRLVCVSLSSRGTRFRFRTRVCSSNSFFFFLVSPSSCPAVRVLFFMFRVRR